MLKNEALAIISKEHLNRYSFFEDGYPHENEVVIKKVNNIWKVFATDERAAVQGAVNIHNTESEALIEFVERLRAGKILDSL